MTAKRETTSPNKPQGATGWAELLELLAEPFPPGAVQWRVGQVSKDRKEARALPYVDARHYERRLDELCPGAWGVRFHGWGANRIICELTIHGVTRASTGEASDGSRAPGTSAEAQAFKRACSKFKLGRYLYSLPAPWMPYDDVKKRLLEVPKLPKLKGLEQPIREQDALDKPPDNTLSRERARAFHKHLSELRIETDERYEAATRLFKREIKSLTQLTEDEALELWNHFKREAARRRNVPPQPVSDQEAAAILGARGN